MYARLWLAGYMVAFHLARLAIWLYPKLVG